MKYSEHVRQDRRLAILRILVEAGGEANDSNLEWGLEALGNTAMLSRPAVVEDMRWLEENQLLQLKTYGERDQVLVATITKLGVAVSKGRHVVEGVSIPSIGV